MQIGSFYLMKFIIIINSDINMGKGRWSLNDLKKAASNLSETLNQTKDKIEKSTPNLQQAQKNVKELYQKSLQSAQEKQASLKKFQEKASEDLSKIRERASEQAQSAMKATEELGKKIESVKDYSPWKKQEGKEVQEKKKIQQNKEKDKQGQKQEKKSEDKKNSSESSNKYTISGITQSILDHANSLKSEAKNKMFKESLKNSLEHLFHKVYWKIVIAFCLGMFIYGIASQIPRQVRLYFREVSRDALDEFKSVRRKKKKKVSDQDDDDE